MNASTPSRRMRGLVRRLIPQTHGQDLIEYALLAAMVTTLAIAALSDIGSKLGDYFADTATRVADGTGGGGGVGGGGGAGDPGGGTGGGGGGTGGGGGATGGGGGRGGGRGN